MKPEIRNGGAHIDTDISSPNEFDAIDTVFLYSELGVLIVAILLLIMAGLSGLIYVGVI